VQVGEAVEKLLADMALVLPDGKSREDIVLTIKHDKTRVPLRPVESWYGKSLTMDTEVRIGGHGTGATAHAFSHLCPSFPT